MSFSFILYLRALFTYCISSTDICSNSILLLIFFLMIRRPPRSTLDRSSAASDVYKRQLECKSKRLSEVLELFTKTAIEVCEGQQFDMEFENRLNVSNVEYLEMIRLKTAVLLACGLKAGALLANADNIFAN